ncbi:DUF1573 domain-containing protein [Candidatus Parcubacteria bacterium]|nr:MAG: DUF1573 domain-containing protein [Candidatus Parcubacteria bacterium]
MKKENILILITLAIILILAIVFTNNKQSSDTNQKSGHDTTESTSNQSTKLFKFDETEFDFGLVKQSGGIVQHKFPFTYNGDQPVNITLVTSCGCTSAGIDKNTLYPGDSATITISFNPNVHAEPEGKFYKTI